MQLDNPTSALLPITLVMPVHYVDNSLYSLPTLQRSVWMDDFLLRMAALQSPVSSARG